MPTNILYERINHIFAYDYGLAPTDSLLTETWVQQDGEAWTSFGNRQRNIGVLIKFDTDDMDLDI